MGDNNKNLQIVITTEARLEALRDLEKSLQKQVVQAQALETVRFDLQEPFKELVPRQRVSVPLTFERPIPEDFIGAVEATDGSGRIERIGKQPVLMYQAPPQPMEDIITITIRVPGYPLAIKTYHIVTK